LVLLLGCPCFYAVLWRSLASVPTWQRIVMATVRSLVLVALAGALAGPKMKLARQNRCTVLLADVSQSMSDEAVEQAEQWATDYDLGRLPRDVVHRVAFDETPRLVKRRFSEARGKPTDASASDYGHALRFSAGMCRADTDRRLVLFGDGLDTHAGMAAAVEGLRQLDFKIDVVPSRVAPAADLAVLRVTPPAGVEVGRPFRVGADLHATRATTARLAFDVDGAPNPREAKREIAISPGDTHIEFESLALRPGPLRFRVTGESEGFDAIVENNRATASIDVKGPPKILYVEGRHDRAMPFRSALSAQRFEVDLIEPTAFPRSLEMLADTAFVVLSDLRRDQLAPMADELLERYVREQGGGLLFAGGSSSYARGGWAGTPLERLLPVTMSVAQQQQVADVALVLVIDRSGSMSGLPLEMAKAACAATVETLRTSDLVEVVAFDAKPVRYVAMQRARARSAIANDLARILSGGDTELFPALDMAYQDLLAVEARRKHVVLLTDGQSPREGLAEIVQNMVAESITLTIVGLGNEVDTDLLRYLAGRGGGRYHAASNPNSLPRIFTHEAETLMQSESASSRFEVHVQKYAEFLRGIPIEHAPALRGYARTEKRPGSAEVILESDRLEPILARMRYGNGWTLAWTSDLRSEWAADWVRWPEYGRFFAQLLRQHQGRRVDRTLPMRVERVGERLKVEVDATTESGTFDNDRMISLTIEGPDPDCSAELMFELVAPGSYQVTHALPRLGDYRLRATHRGFDEKGQAMSMGESTGQVSLSYPLEYERLAPDLRLLEQLARAGGGRFDPSPETVRDTERRTIVEYQPYHVPCLLLGLILLCVDAFFKRIRFRRSAHYAAA
jgi:uncharacterized membrane protein